MHTELQISPHPYYVSAGGRIGADPAEAGRMKAKMTG